MRYEDVVLDDFGARVLTIDHCPGCGDERVTGGYRITKKGKIVDPPADAPGFTPTVARRGSARPGTGGGRRYTPPVPTIREWL
jgi:hypothetical protein